jgi:Fe-Mn family superoxide dismutase
MFRPRILRSLNQVRRLHQVPPLVRQSVFDREGVPGLLSNDGFSIAWTQYQGFIIEKLNYMTAGKFRPSRN